jgi:hypothetical protein
MTYEEFQEYVRAKCLYETIYSDSDGREILIIQMLAAYALVNRAPKREWVGLTGVEVNHIFAANVGYPERMMKEVEAKLKEKNT